jgi:ornithine cyclodeaminase/alanine dehydrogenase-like protein (mu-crystallin family)
MKQYRFDDIVKLNIPAGKCVDWVREAFLIKETVYLPPKFSLKLDDNIFINTMPSYIPTEGVFGVKVVTRYPKNIPSLDSIILMFDSVTGEQIAMMDGNWITAMRTGAVAALAVKTFQSSSANIISILGLGNTARATLLCLLALFPERKFVVKLLRYKDQADLFRERFSQYRNIEFVVVEENKQLIQDSDVIISCVTAADAMIGEDIWFKEGVLVVPVHTRGFQNCDLFFDRVFADDTDHVKGFKYFSKFKTFDEFSSVLHDNAKGRRSDRERILSYNIGIALHDVFYASKILKMSAKEHSITIDSPVQKFWI